MKVGAHTNSFSSTGQVSWGNDAAFSGGTDALGTHVPTQSQQVGSVDGGSTGPGSHESEHDPVSVPSKGS